MEASAAAASGSGSGSGSANNDDEIYDNLSEDKIAGVIYTTTDLDSKQVSNLSSKVVTPNPSQAHQSLASLGEVAENSSINDVIRSIEPWNHNGVITDNSRVRAKIGANIDEYEFKMRMSVLVGFVALIADSDIPFSLFNDWVSTYHSEFHEYVKDYPWKLMLYDNKQELNDNKSNILERLTLDHRRDTGRFTTYRKEFEKLFFPDSLSTRRPITFSHTIRVNIGIGPKTRTIPFSFEFKYSHKNRVSLVISASNYLKVNTLVRREGDKYAMKILLQLPLKCHLTQFLTLGPNEIIAPNLHCTDDQPGSNNKFAIIFPGTSTFFDNMDRAFKLLITTLYLIAIYPVSGDELHVQQRDKEYTLKFKTLDRNTQIMFHDLLMHPHLSLENMYYFVLILAGRDGANLAQEDISHAAADRLKKRERETAGELREVALKLSKIKEHSDHSDASDASDTSGVAGESSTHNGGKKHNNELYKKVYTKVINDKNKNIYKKANDRKEYICCSKEYVTIKEYKKLLNKKLVKKTEKKPVKKSEKKTEKKSVKKVEKKPVKKVEKKTKKL